MKIEIIFNDGSTETVENVHDYRVRDGVLHAVRREMYETDLGFWPLTNIRKWKTDEQR